MKALFVALTRTHLERIARMPKFMMILHHTPDAYQKLPPDELGQMFAANQVWKDNIISSGRFVSSEKLQEEGGKSVSLQKGRVSVTDGPYAEVKEVVGGYMVFRATDYAEALEVAQGCPLLKLGWIGLRQTDSLGCGGD